MKLIWRVFLAQVLLIAQIAPQLSFAEGAPAQPAGEFLSLAQDQMNLRGLHFQQNSTAPRVVNEYRLLGFEHIPDITHDAFRQALKAQPYLLTANLSTVRENAKFQSLLETAAGRRELIRQAKQSFASLSVVMNENLAVKLKESYKGIEKEVAKRYPFQANMTDAQILERAQRITIETNIRVLETFSGAEREAAAARVHEAVALLSDPRARAGFNATNGISTVRLPSIWASFSISNQIANLRGKRMYIVTDQFGKKQKVFWDKSAEGMKKVKPVELLKGVRNGSFEMGRFGLIFLTIMFLGAGIKLVSDFEADPIAFEQMLEQMLSFAMPLSITSFFLGAAGTGKALNALNVQRKALLNLNWIEKTGKYILSPELKSRLVKANMNSFAAGNSFMNMGYGSMAGGFLISKFVFKYIHSMESCFKVADTHEGRYSKFQRARFEESCKKTFFGIAGELMSDPRTYMELTALLSARAIMSYGMSKVQFQKYHVANQQKLAKLKKIPNKSFRMGIRLSIVGRGLVAAPLVSSIVAFGVFTLVFIAVLWVLERVYKHLSITVPVKRAADNIRGLMKRYRSEGWDMTKLCDDRTIFEGGFFGNINAAWNWDYEEKCGEDLLKGFLKHYSEINSGFRSTILKPVADTIEKWNEYLFQATNLYDASYTLYKDIVGQIKVQKDLEKNNIRNFDFKTSKGFLGLEHVQGYNNHHLYNHPLPLFRSEPYFGWSYRLKDSENETISYPIINGATVTWEERVHDKEKIGFLEKRMESFKTEVLPKVRSKFSKLTEESRWFDRDTQKAFKEINGLLSSDKDDEIFYALHLISKEAEKENKEYQCRRHIAPGKPLQHICVFKNFQKEFLDEDFYQETKPDETREGVRYLHPNKFYGGYQTDNVKPYGVKPLGPGQRFFINYYEKFQNNNIDFHYFPSGYTGLVDYLVKQMVCGVDVANGEEMLSNDFWYMLGIKSPKFEAPKISLKGNAEPCDRSSRFHPDYDHGWRGDYGFYSRIEDSSDTEKAYGGIVDFLYNEISEEVIQDFDGWWEEHVQPQFAAVVDKLYQEYFVKEVISEKLDNVITKHNVNTNCYEICREFPYYPVQGIAASIKAELDTYFTYILVPMVNDLPYDSRFFEEEIEGILAKDRLLFDFVKIKNQIYDIFDFLSDKRTELLDPDNKELFSAILTQASAEFEARYGSASQNYNVLKIKALELLQYKRFYEMQILFKADSETFLKRVFTVHQDLIYANEELTEAEQKELIEAAKQELSEARDAFDSMANRDGKVLVEYNDWPEGDGISPTLEVVEFALALMQKQFDELKKLQMLKYSIEATSR